MSKEKFKSFFKHTLKWEGGGKLHNVKGDSGGWTVWGIAYNKNKHLFSSLEEFKNLTYQEASDIVYNKYYLPIYTDKLPLDCQLLYFDMAYNMGNSRAVKIMQKCLGIKEDGKIGKITKSKLHLVTVDCLYQQRNNWYKLLNDKTSWGSKFYKGWMRRSEDIYLKSKEVNEEFNKKVINNSSDHIDSMESVSTKQKESTVKGLSSERKNTDNKDGLLNYIKKWTVSKSPVRYPKREGDY